MSLTHINGGRTHFAAPFEVSDITNSLLLKSAFKKKLKHILHTFWKCSFVSWSEKRDKGRKKEGDTIGLDFDHSFYKGYMQVLLTSVGIHIS